MRNKKQSLLPSNYSKESSKSTSVSQTISGFIDKSFDWHKYILLKEKFPQMNLGLKGIQCIQDLEKAYSLGCRLVVISNHGGRQVDTCRNALEVL
mmetsp:Transcript_92903/g.200881  ORF Transcript_92903/g.200881 Transcript_92903/m.200881 type:complete len:95 (+) Transcript_92903:555-839(+)